MLATGNGNTTKPAAREVGGLDVIRGATSTLGNATSTLGNATSTVENKLPPSAPAAPAAQVATSAIGVTTTVGASRIIPFPSDVAQRPAQAAPAGRARTISTESLEKRSGIVVGDGPTRGRGLSNLSSISFNSFNGK